jgi:hypothetical protein
MKLYTLSIFFGLGILASSAFASNYECTIPQASFQERLTIEGVGNSAQIHIDDPTLSGDLTINTQVPSPVAGYVVAIGPCMTKNQPPVKSKGVFLFQPAILNGSSEGTMGRMGANGFVILSCDRVH